MKYKISVRTLNGIILTFTVTNYEIEENSFICFTDIKTGQKLKFSCSNVQITEVLE